MICCQTEIDVVRTIIQITKRLTPSRVSTYTGVLDFNSFPAKILRFNLFGALFCHTILGSGRAAAMSVGVIAKVARPTEHFFAYLANLPWNSFSIRSRTACVTASWSDITASVAAAGSNSISHMVQSPIAVVSVQALCRRGPSEMECLLHLLLAIRSSPLTRSSGGCESRLRISETNAGCCTKLWREIGASWMIWRSLSAWDRR